MGLKEGKGRLCEICFQVFATEQDHYTVIRAVCGNLDCGLMLSGNPEQVYEKAVEIIEACKGKPGFIFGNSNAVAQETPLENYRAMLNAWRDHAEIFPQ